MSSVQQNSGDLIEFNSAENVDVLDKPNGGIVQQIVMGETESATLIATAVAKLTSSSVTVKPITSIPAKSESDPNVLDAVPVAAALAPTPQPPSSAIARNPNRPAVDVAFVAAAATQIDISSDSSQSSQVDSDADVSYGQLNEPEKTLVYVRDLTKVYVDELHEVPLSTTPNEPITGQPDEEDETEKVDHLSPLIMDNHTVLEHRELFKESLLNNVKEFLPSSHFRMPLNHTLEAHDVTDHRRSSLEYSSDAVSSDENAKDTAKDAHTRSDEEDLEPIEIPSEDMAEKIVQQVEFYFSNENILKDAFLLKHVRRNKEGFVSLKLISSFKRVRQLTKDWRVVGYAIKLKSKHIEVNTLSTKIRRVEPLPVFDETMPSRTVVATDIPFDKITIEKVSEIFSKFGEIALIRILHAGGNIPPDVRQFINKYPELHQKECAFVEYTESRSARCALTMETNMQIFEMVAPKKKTGKKASVTKLIESYINANNSGHLDSGDRSRNSSIDYKLRRNSSNFYVKPEHQCGTGQQQQQQQSQQQPQPLSQSPTQLQGTRKYSFNNADNCEHFTRRLSNAGPIDSSRKYSSCSEGYSSCSEMSRRTSNCSDMSRRTSNCSDNGYGRRLSGCSEFCACSRRSSQCSDQYRRPSQCSEHGRRFSNTSIGFHERRMSNGSDGSRRISFDGDYERKISIGCEHHRKISGTFEPIRKYSNEHLRKASIDSGYDRKYSTGSMSDYSSSPRSRSNSFLKNSDNLVRTPIGPDGSKGFSTRARKVGQVIVPV